MNKKETLSGIYILGISLIVSWLWFSSEGLSRAPEITFKLIDGRQITTASLIGKPALITFWATTCPGCIKEMPHLVELYHEFSELGLEIIGVAMYYDPPNQVIDLVKRRQLPYPVALDIDGSIARAFDNVMLTPTSFLISADGKILQHKIGEMDMVQLRQTLSEILSTQTAGGTTLLANNH